MDTSSLLAALLSVACGEAPDVGATAIDMPWFGHVTGDAGGLLYVLERDNADWHFSNAVQTGGDLAQWSRTAAR